jgi:hypothetical protein
VKGRSLLEEKLVPGAAFPHHDGSAVRAVPFDARDPTPAGNPRVALETNAKTSATRVVRFVELHDDLLSIGGPGELESGPFSKPLPPEPAGLVTNEVRNLRANTIRIGGEVDGRRFAADFAIVAGGIHGVLAESVVSDHGCIVSVKVAWLVVAPFNGAFIPVAHRLF